MIVPPQNVVETCRRHVSTASGKRGICRIHFLNWYQFEIAIVVLSAPSNRLADLQPLVPRILEILPNSVKGAATVVTAN